MIRLSGPNQIKLLFSFALLSLAAAHMRWPATLDQVGLLVVFLALLPWVIPYLRANFKSVEAVGIKLDLIERKVDNQAKRIDELYLLSMGEKVFTHLRKLGDPEYGACFVGTALPRELGYLEALGFIRFRGKLKGLDDFLEQFNGREAPNLSDYIEITETGRAFLELRKEAIQGLRI